MAWSLHHTALLVAVLGIAPRCGAAPVDMPTEVQVDPPVVRLTGPDAMFSLLITGTQPDGRAVDLTGEAQFRSLSPERVGVSSRGVLSSITDGQGQVEVVAAGRTLNVQVTVEHSSAPRQINFENDIIPLLSKFGCNSSGCHGKAEGQNGFKLSVFGFDPPADYAALTKEARGRRVFLAQPDQSLLLRKASGRAPHGGGVRISADSREYALLRSWIAAGIPFGLETDPKVVSIELQPRERQLTMHAAQQLRVLATYSDARVVDVTRFAKFQSNNDGLAAVDDTGRVEASNVPGRVAVMATFMGAVDVFQALIPRQEPLPASVAWPEQNFIDPLVFGRLKKLNIAPSELSSDAEYLRRVYLDIIGTLPTSDEARAFLASTAADRREQLVESLLARPEYADFWALKWSDLLRVDRAVLEHHGAYSFYRWIRKGLAENQPLDEFARQILTAEGTLSEVPAAHLYKVTRTPGESASTISQVFLGVRIACAQCHHHPYDRWGQTDYQGMIDFFTPVTFKPTPRGDMLIINANVPPSRHPRSNEIVPAHALGEPMPEEAPAGDRRKVLADWMTSSQNPWFARNWANRLWAHFVGRGLVEPIDDVRATNPPTNPELLDTLARYLIDHHFDAKALIRAIIASRVYQLSSAPTATNAGDELNYSRALLKRMDAEVLLDAVCRTTDVPEKFAGVPAGSRAIQLWDSRVPHYFLGLFGRPKRLTACDCERSSEPSVSQVLHFLNGPDLHGKLSHEGGSIARLVRQIDDNQQLADELYLTFFARHPSSSELQAATEYIASSVSRNGAEGRRAAAEDLAWSMLNSLEFVFNH